MNNEKTINSYFREDRRSALDAKYEAQKIAFAPYVFQSAFTLRKLGILECLFKTDSSGISIPQIAQKLHIPEYGLEVLLEFGLSIEIVKLCGNHDEQMYCLGKIGYFILHDKMTNVNMNFMHDICYAGAAHLEESILSGKPEGLKELGNWPTIYEGLSQLPALPRKSWFNFDHYYSDSIFPDALPIVFRHKVKRLMDIGGNTAEWALLCVEYNKDVTITIVDLPGQTAMAEEIIAEQSLKDRINTWPQDVLNLEKSFPTGYDTVWMSQFLDCFSKEEIRKILSRLYLSIDEECDVYVMEPLWDQQKYRAATFSLHATSLYFTTMANGNGKMYSRDELVETIEISGFHLEEEIRELGLNDYTLLRFRKVFHDSQD